MGQEAVKRYRPDPATVDVSVYLRSVGAWAMYLDDSVARLKIFEGGVAWMYADSNGIVTSAFGRALFQVADAQALSFGVAGRKATAAEIAADFERVKAMPKGLVAKRYRVAPSPLLDDGEMAAMLVAKVQEFDSTLRVRLAGYTAAPDAAKIALLDMAYNLGVDGLLKFTHLCAAVKAGLWMDASGLCHREGPSAERNAWTAGQFKSAASEGMA